MADEIWNPDFREPGQSVPTPPVPVIAPPPGLTPIQNNPAPAPVLTNVAFNGGEHGSIDPSSDRVCAWWMEGRQRDMWGPSLDAQFAANGPLKSLNDWSLANFDRPAFLPSTSLMYMQGLGMVWRVIGASLGYALPPAGKKRGAKIGWAVAGFLAPTLTTGAVAARQVFK